MSAWTKFATKFYQQQKKKNSDYKFSQALKDAAKAYKKGGDVKVGEPITDEAAAIAAINDINACTTKEKLEAVVKRIDVSLNDNEDVQKAAEAKFKEFEQKGEAVVAQKGEADAAPTGEAVVAQKGEADAAPMKEVDVSSLGGKKSKKSAKKGKKSAKKGKKSVKKGGKNGKKSAKKSRR